MDYRLEQDLNHYFSVFLNNTEHDLHQLLPPTPAARKYQIELEAELAQLRAAVMKRLEEALR